MAIEGCGVRLKNSCWTPLTSTERSENGGQGAERKSALESSGFRALSYLDFGEENLMSMATNFPSILAASAMTRFPTWGRALLVEIPFC